MHILWGMGAGLVLEFPLTLETNKDVKLLTQEHFIQNQHTCVSYKKAV